MDHPRALGKLGTQGNPASFWRLELETNLVLQKEKKYQFKKMISDNDTSWTIFCGAVSGVPKVFSKILSSDIANRNFFEKVDPQLYWGK